MLTGEEVDYIVKDLNLRGIVAEEIQDEIIDHVCSSVEGEMARGKKFIDAYHQVLKSFGHTTGLRETQKNSVLPGNQTTRIMLRNYIKIGWRNLRKQSFYSIINTFGLAIGISACLVIVLFILDELSYDRYNLNANRIFRVEAQVKFGGSDFKMAYRPAPESNVLVQDFPDVESSVRFASGGSYLVKTRDEGENIKEKNAIWADSTFFKIFSVKVVEGDGAKALNQPASVAISRKLAEKYYPGKSALGQPIILDNNYHMRVAAVYEDIPDASHFHFDIIISMLGDFPICRGAKSTSFMSENFLEYVLLKPGVDAKQFEAKLPLFVEKHMGPEVAQALGGEFTMEKFRAFGNKYDLSLRPLTDIHLHSDVRGEVEANGSIVYVYLLGAVAIFILVIGSINFMNLSTARSANRAKEVGMRKVMGSLRTHLVRQFLIESILVTAFSFAVALLIAFVALPFFNDLSEKHLQLPFDSPLFYGILLLACLFVGMLAGIYPSFFLSAFKPINVLKGRVALGMSSGLIRSSLVVFQFVISIFLIVGAIAVNEQLHFIQHKKLGFEKDQVIIIHDAYALRPHNAVPFKNELLKSSAIESGTISGYLPIENDWSWRSNNSTWNFGSQPTTENMVSTQIWNVDYDYVNTFHMRIKTGRDFSEDFKSDSTAVIVNETMARRLGLGPDPIGKKINTFNGPPDPNHILSWTVIGVLEDFHFSSMKESILPLALTLGNSDGSVCFRFKPNQTEQVIEQAGKVWKNMAPGQPFQYSFLNEDFGRMYFAEQRLGKIFTLFAGLAIVIACLGLFALTAFTAEQRTKEIGIRKVMGASVRSIVLLLSQEFGKLIVIAFLVAAPVAWFAIRWWLSHYNYRVEIGWTVYALAGVIAFIIAFATMSFQSVKAATSDPVKSLRNE